MNVDITEEDSNQAATRGPSENTRWL